MGHTVTSQRMMIDVKLAELKDFCRALRKDQRLLVEDLLKIPLKYVGAISNASSVDMGTMILLAIILEQQEKIKALEALNGRVAD